MGPRLQGLIKRPFRREQRPREKIRYSCGVPALLCRRLPSPVWFGGNARAELNQPKARDSGGKHPTTIVPAAGTSHAVGCAMHWRSLPYLVAFGSAWAAHAQADFDSTATAFPPWPHTETPEPEPRAAAPRRPELAEPQSREPRAGYGQRPLHLELVTGVATTVGLVGVAGELDLGNPLSLGAGVGGNGYGVDWEVHARFRPIYSLPPERHFFSALTVQGTFASSLNSNTSLIPGIDCDTNDIHDGCYAPPVVPERVYWAQSELGWEGMFQSGLTLRVATGLARELGSPSWHCEISGQIVPCGSLPARTVFVQTFAVGYAF